MNIFTTARRTSAPARVEGESAAPVPPAGPHPRPTLSALLGTALFLAAAWVLHRELAHAQYHQVLVSLRVLPVTALVLALLLTALDYLLLTAYDQLGFAYIGRRIARRRVALAAFVGYAISNNVGFSLLSGTSARYCFYSRWGLAPEELARVVLIYMSTTLVALLSLGGVVLAFVPPPALVAALGRGPARGLGALLLLAALAYAMLPLLRRQPLRLGRFNVPVPSARLVAGQFVLGIVDWLVAAAVLYVLLPPGGVSYAQLVGAFLAAQVLGLVSHVPGGLGVFEGAMLLLLRDRLPPEDLLATLVVYRVLYYLLPLAAALALLLADEGYRQRHRVRRPGGAFGALTREVAPRLLAVFVFLVGAVLLFSGATPAVPARLAWLHGFLPPVVFEASHFVGSIVGVCLLLVARGIAQRLDAAYYATLALLGAGAVASLLKGGDYEEALVLAAVAGAVVLGRGWFDRRAALWQTRFSAGWMAAVVAVVAASIWLGLFAYRDVAYSGDLWWRFEAMQDAPRFLRASVGVMLCLLVFGLLRLLRPVTPALCLPDEAELERAAAVVARQTSTYPYLAFLGDKALLWNAGGDGFLMYGVRGRTWVALGDPVGAGEGGAAELIRTFLERADASGAQAVFYEVSPQRLHDYADFGLVFVKLGEEARVPLEDFSLDGREHKGFRQVLNRLERAGVGFRILTPQEVPAALPELRAVSDEWLADKATSEKGFSLGAFREEYLRRFPVAVLECAGRIEAFANLWPGAGQEELSLDLMRFRRTAPENSMEGLLLHLMLWGKAQGYRWFNLGVAPLSGLEPSPVAPLWTRAARQLYARGEHFYNFQGLRAYKEKFHPQWEPRYLAYPGGLALPRILADLAALISGGFARILR